MVDSSKVRRDGGRMRRGRLIGAALVLAALAGCSSKSTDMSSAAAPMAANQPETAGKSAGNGVTADAPAAGTASGPASLNVNALAQTGSDGTSAGPAMGGSFISTATMTVKVADVAETKPKLVTLVQSLGGGLFGEDTTFGAKARSVISVKVPPAKFTQALQELGALGTLASEQVKTDDVTQQVVDLRCCSPGSW